MNGQWLVIDRGHVVSQANRPEKQRQQKGKGQKLFKACPVLMTLRGRIFVCSLNYSFAVMLMLRLYFLEYPSDCKGLGITLLSKSKTTRGGELKGKRLKDVCLLFAFPLCMQFSPEEYLHGGI